MQTDSIRTLDDDTLKDRWFSRYGEAKHAEETYTRQAQDWLDRATSITKELTDMPRSASSNIHTDDAYAARLDCVDEAERQAVQARKTMHDIEQTIGQHPDPLCRDYLRYRYIDGLTMLQASLKMGTAECSIYRLRHKALDYYHVIESSGGFGYALLPDSFYSGNKSEGFLNVIVYAMLNRGNV